MLQQYKTTIYGDTDGYADPKLPVSKPMTFSSFTDRVKSYGSKYQSFQSAQQPTAAAKDLQNDITSDKGTPKVGSNLSLATEEFSAKYYARKLNSLYRPRVMDAYYNRKIFCVYGNYHALRRALFQRGWIEKLVPGRYDSIQKLNDETLLTYSRTDNNFEAVAIHKIIGDLPAFFVWQFRKQPNIYAEVQPYRNVIRRQRNLDFSTKVGLIACAENEHWFCTDNCEMLYPRFYRLGVQDEDRTYFIEDFRCTQCHNLLRYVQEKMKKPQEVIDRERGTVPFALYKKAVELTRRFIDKRESLMTDGQWDDFIADTNKVIKEGLKFKVSIRDFKLYANTLEALFKQLEEKYPNFNWDGYRNIWILKPGYWCRGSGIVLRDSISSILEFTDANASRRYIAQKYIERPLLIYNTKFDIRQYMIVSLGMEKVSIWLYRDCYLKFSSQLFNLEDLRESIHLTNNSVQKNYENDSTRDVKLPKSNMWSLLQFKQYLISQGHKAEEIWEKKIFAGFKKNLISVVLSSMEDTEMIPNSFELYGCDFMLDEQFNPILIEINATPDLSPSTEVTNRLCPMVLKDLVKVIVDIPRNKSATTGLFELVFELSYHFNQNYAEGDLNVHGKSMTIHKVAPKTIERAIVKPLMKPVVKPPERKPNVLTTAFMTLSAPNKQKSTSTLIQPINSTFSMRSDGGSHKRKKTTKKSKKFVDASTAALQKKIRDIHRGLDDSNTFKIKGRYRLSTMGSANSASSRYSSGLLSKQTSKLGSKQLSTLGSKQLSTLGSKQLSTLGSKQLSTL